MKKEDLRIVFMGTPEFAETALRKVVESGFNVVGVVTMPDKPMGRHGSVLQSSPVKKYAQSVNIPVLQPEKLKSPEFLQELEELKDKEETLVFYESPFRVKQLMESLVEVLGENRKVVLAREITKRYEEFIRGTAEEVRQWTDENDMRGEFVVIIEGNHEVEQENIWAEWSILEHVEYKMNYEKMSSKQAIKEVAIEREIPKREVYAAYHGL